MSRAPGVVIFGAQVPLATPVLVVLQPWQASVQAVPQQTLSLEQMLEVH
jgi:hypothetical protein